MSLFRRECIENYAPRKTKSAESAADMATYDMTEKMRLAAMAASHAGRTAMKTVIGSAPLRWIAGPPAAYQFVLIPQDLRTADPSLSAEMYDGYFGLAGAVAPIGSQSPFEVRAPSQPWLRELHAFSWLRHLHAAQDDVARERARGLVRDWLALGARAPDVTWETDIAARRLIVWLSHAGFVLDRADAEFYDAYMSALTRQLHTLSLSGRDEGQNIARLRALVASTLASLCVAEFEPQLSSYTPSLAAELDRQILPDGGHVSRNPGAIVDILLDLLPLRQCFISRGFDVPEALNEAISRLVPMLRFMRLGNGGLARFNGMAATRVDEIANILAYDDKREEPDNLTIKSDYARLAKGDAVVIADVGGPPPLSASEGACAGCLAFEFSSGENEIVVNCGAPGDEESEWHIVSRATAAHSTLTVNDASSARLIKRQLLQPPREIYLLSNPRAVRAEISIGDERVTLRAAHDGYRERFGLLHQRLINLSHDGQRLDGVDQLLDPRKNATSASADVLFGIRFHMHPRVKMSLLPDERGAALTLPTGERWQFTAKGAAMEIEESIFLADPIFRRRCLQIVLTGPCYPPPNVEWSFQKIMSAPAKPRQFD